MNTPQTRFVTLSTMKVTNTEHTAINGNHSKCRMTLIKRMAVALLYREGNGLKKMSISGFLPPSFR